MPHQIIEYSKNLEGDLDIEGLLEVLHETAARIEAFPVAGLRTRAVARDHFRIADADENNSFVHVVLRIAHGRTLDVQKAAGNEIFEALCEFLQPAYATRPLAISFEMQEINPDLRWKQNNLREYLDKRSEQRE